MAIKPLDSFAPDASKEVLCLVETRDELRYARAALVGKLQETHTAQMIPGEIPEPGEHAYEKHTEWLDLHAEVLKGFKKIILCFAQDQRRRRYCEALVTHLTVARCWRPALPGGAVTLSGAFAMHGAEMVTRALAEAEPWPPAGVTRVEELLDILIHDRINPPDRGLAIGIGGLSQCYRVRRGEFTLVHGVPGHGKTTFMSAMIAYMITEHHWKFVVFSPEQKSEADFVEQIMEHIHNRPYRDTVLPDGTRVPGLSMDDIGKTVRFLNEYLFLLRSVSDAESLKVADMLDAVRKLDAQHEIDGMVADPYSQFDTKRPSWKTLGEHTTEQLSMVLRFARSHDMHCWLVAHPTKIKKAESGPYKGKTPPPLPYDVADSRAFYQVPDHIICIWRDLAVVTRNEFHVQKVRDRHAGELGMVKTNYDTLRFKYDAVVE